MKQLRWHLCLAVLVLVFLALALPGTAAAAPDGGVALRPVSGSILVDQPTQPTFAVPGIFVLKFGEKAGTAELDLPALNTVGSVTGLTISPSVNWDTVTVSQKQPAILAGAALITEGKITVQGPQLQFGKEAPSTPTGAWGEATFAKMALMGSWQANHNAFYMGRHGASVYDQRYPDCRHQDCVTQALDAAATASSAVAVTCAMAGPNPCVAVAGFTSFGFSAVGAGWTIWNALQEKSSALDVAVAVPTLRVGTRSPQTGLGTSVFQWTWDTFVVPREHN